MCQNTLGYYFIPFIPFTTFSLIFTCSQFTTTQRNMGRSAKEGCSGGCTKIQNPSTVCWFSWYITDAGCYLSALWQNWIHDFLYYFQHSCCTVCCNNIPKIRYQMFVEWLKHNNRERLLVGSKCCARIWHM